MNSAVLASLPDRSTTHRDWALHATASGYAGGDVIQTPFADREDILLIGWERPIHQNDVSNAIGALSQIYPGAHVAVLTGMHGERVSVLHKVLAQKGAPLAEQTLLTTVKSMAVSFLDIMLQEGAWPIWLLDILREPLFFSHDVRATAMGAHVAVVDVVDILSAFRPGEAQETNTAHVARRIDWLTAPAKIIVCAWCYSAQCPIVTTLAKMCSGGKVDVVRP